MYTYTYIKSKYNSDSWTYFSGATAVSELFISITFRNISNMHVHNVKVYLIEFLSFYYKKKVTKLSVIFKFLIPPVWLKQSKQNLFNLKCAVDIFK